MDRCESCHLGIREPVALTAADMGGERVFVSHPNKTLLTIHDPERFGCTPCHNGNGLATSSVEKAHGQYEHWLWPLFAKENAEAGCLQCHFNDRVLDYAPVLDPRPRSVPDQGLHRLPSLRGVRPRSGRAGATSASRFRSLETQQKEARLEADREIKQGDQAE